MSHPANRNHVGRSVPRKEDARLLTGRGQFVDDIDLPQTAHVVFVRSTMAHAAIRSVDLTEARQAPGVVFAIAGAELAPQVKRPPVAPLLFPESWKSAVRHRFDLAVQPLLATGKVRHVGEPVAVIVAETRNEARDAAERVVVDYAPLPAIVDIAGARAPDAPRLHEQFASNLAGEFSVGKGVADAALAAAPHRLRRQFHHHRYSGMPLECRAMIAAYDRRREALDVWATSQAVHMTRREIAQTLGLPEARVRCIAPDVGGSFGVKTHGIEYPLVAWLAWRLQRPVKWIEERHEHMVSAVHARDQQHDIEVGFDNDGRILALKDHFLVDSGAWLYIGGTVPYNTAMHLLGPYKVDNVAISCGIVTTNKTPAAPYRGAGRPEAVFAIERMLDLVARALGLEPDVVRQRNMVAAAEMPYAVGLPYRDGKPIVYDSGDYPDALAKALAAIGGVPAFRRRQKEARAQGRYLGLGIAAYTEGTGVGPFEGAVVRIDSSGKLLVSAGVSSQGQGMETVFAQVCADIWSVGLDDVIVTLGDSAAIDLGVGTMASRSTVTVGSAIHIASDKLKRKVLAIAAHQLECAPEDIELRGGRVGVVGVPGRDLTLAQIAFAARPGWEHGRPAGVEPGLQETHYFEPATVTWAYAVSVALVEVDAGTGRVTVERFVVAHDCGNEINPMLVQGQVAGGTVQGIGGALWEALVYDAEGQLLTGSFMDYALPRAADVPEIEVVPLHAPSPLNPLGVKGVGEGGTIAPPAAIANAVCDALAPFGFEINATPVRPEAILQALRTPGLPG